MNLGGLGRVGESNATRKRSVNPYWLAAVVLLIPIGWSFRYSVTGDTHEEILLVFFGGYLASLCALAGLIDHFLRRGEKTKSKTIARTLLAFGVVGQLVAVIAPWI